MPPNLESCCRSAHAASMGRPASERAHSTMPKNLRDGPFSCRHSRQRMRISKPHSRQRDRLSQVYWLGAILTSKADVEMRATSFPLPVTSDAEDVALALETAQALWKNLDYAE